MKMTVSPMARRVWQMIGDLKQGRCVILTTQ